MDKPLGEHIRGLEARLEQLNDHLMDSDSSNAERNGIEAEIRAVNLALSHYRAAFELEKALVRPRES